jgi:universal stress protein E
MPDTAVPLHKILVAMDFSKHAAAALRRAVDLAEQTQGEVTLVHILEHVAAAVEGTSFEAHWRLPPAALHQAEHQLRRQAEERLAEVIAPYRGSRCQLHTEVRAGVPFVEIIRSVEKNGVDLVMTGTRGLSGFQRFLVGSTAERLVRKCPCPVWIVKFGSDGPLRSILVPVDFSEASGKSLELGSLLARLSGCPLHVVHVIASTDPVVQVPEDKARMDIRVQRREIRVAAAKHLNAFVRTCVPPEIAVQERLVVGSPWQKIAFLARRVDADLIIMGSVGRTGIVGFLIGNTAEKVLRQCNCSLLTVKPDGFVSPIQPEP